MTVAAPAPATGGTVDAGVAVSRLEARNLKKFYGSREVVKDVSLAVGKGEVVGLLGPMALARPRRST